MVLPSQHFAETISSLKLTYPGLVVQFKDTRKQGIVEFDYLFLPKSSRQQGIGSEVMEKLLAVADLHGLTVRGIPSDVFGTPKSVLITWYAKFGFDIDKSQRVIFRTPKVIPHAR